MSTAWFAGAALAAPGSATLIVVRDVGGVSALPYYAPLSVDAQVAQPVPGEAPATSLDPFPVHSSQLSPGPVVPRPLDIAGFAPIFLIGDDAFSRRWLSEQAPRLRDLHATGFVVEVLSRSAFESLQRLAPGIPLSPASGDDLAQRLKIEHYPVLMTGTRLGP